MKILQLILCGIVLLSIHSNGKSQDLESLISRYSGENADGYIEPLITAFGANLNSGVYRNARVPQSGLHLNFGLNAMLSIFSDDQKTFSATTEGYFNPVQNVLTPTVVGDGEGTLVIGTGGTAFQFPGGYSLKSFVSAAPTITVGSLFGTEFSGRYFSSEISDDIGKLKLLGLGFRHSISQYIPLSPVDIAAGFFYHDFKVGDIIQANTWIAHAEVGKSFLFLDLYAGLGYGKSKAEIDYTFVLFGETQNVNIDVTGKNKLRATFGLGLNLLVFHVNLDYNVGHQNLINASASVGL